MKVPKTGRHQETEFSSPLRPCPGQDRCRMSSLASGNSTKAGLPQSFEEINEIIKDASKESKYTAAQEKKAAQLQQRIVTLKNDLQAAMNQVKPVSRARRQVDELVANFEALQAAQFAAHETECAVCVDMDAFFASVESLDAPELRTVPMAVGSTAMLSTANYEARKFGVSAAMPGYIAMKLCPQLRIVEPNFDKYRHYSAKVSAILAEYDSNLTMFSLDEAFLHLRRDKDGPSFAEIVNEMRTRVREATGLTCSAGIASNLLLAKMASNINKPDGQFEIPRDNVEAMRKFLHAQPVKRIPGVGKVMATTLEGVFGIATVGDLHQNIHLLPLIFKEKTVQSLVAGSLGHQSLFFGQEDDASGPSEPQHRQSISCERTFLPASRDMTVLRSLLIEIIAQLQEDVEKAGIVGCGSVGIKLKSADFAVSTRERRSDVLARNLDWSLVLRIVERLLEGFLEADPAVRIRLFGVRLSKLKFASSLPQASSAASNEKDYCAPKPATGLEKWLQTAAKEDKPADSDRASNGPVCPVCNRVLPVGVDDVRALNEHLDECLTRASLRENKQ